ncbi:flagellar basal-body rod protein FlgB [Rhizobiales bacterium GAS191]|nr:flagellar basal-body rod protein FlgB [Rhizobiales bacterium GAS113]SED39223.1 flagellar basal-body rod protein FlgB [Rhizobiales bacterium GAS188]SEE94821.1 flagellar basal-body rod protein FlgB [Rhizobiales bacterium GAS191]
MGPIHLFDIASLQARWLSIRQTTIATNISNANTPGFSSLDVHSFQDVLDKTQLNLATTNVSHIAISPTELSTTAAKTNDPWEVTRSGNSVSLEQEMMKAGDVNRSFSLNTSIVKAFNAMLTQSVKG